MLGGSILFSKISYLQPPGPVKIHVFPLLPHSGKKNKKQKTKTPSCDRIFHVDLESACPSLGKAGGKAVWPPLLSHFLLLR